jgi:hypothetical protein
VHGGSEVFVPNVEVALATSATQDVVRSRLVTMREVTEN